MGKSLRQIPRVPMGSHDGGTVRSGLPRGEAALRVLVHPEITEKPLHWSTREVPTAGGSSTGRLCLCECEYECVSQAAVSEHQTPL